jgi:uncharacterized membrane protein YcfT
MGTLKETSAQNPEPPSRVDWVDHAKGISILLVVMMHSTLGVEAAAGAIGWLHPVVEFAKPFRMPAFFLISGLFLARTIDAPWRRYLDRKVVHFAYFYVLWLTIQYAFKGLASPWRRVPGQRSPPISPVSSSPSAPLWFIYVLPVFFLFTRLVRGLPVWLVLAWAAVLEIMPIATGSVIYDEFAARYVYFFAGYALAGRTFAFQDWTAKHTTAALAGLAAWLALNATASLTVVGASLEPYAQIFTWDNASVKWSDLAGLSLLLGIAGSAALVTIAGASVTARLDAPSAMGRCPFHRHLSGVFLPMAVARTILLKLGVVTDIGTISALTWIAAVSGPVVLYVMIQWTGIGRFLFERPAWPASIGASRARRPKR